MATNQTCNELTSVCHFLADIGLGTSTSGNASLRSESSIYLTPTGVSLKDIAPDRLAQVDLEGRRMNELAPTKEVDFHLAIYRNRNDIKAIVHVHPTYGIAVSTLLKSAIRQCIPAITPQFVMRAGSVPTLPYFPPGSSELADTVAQECLLTKALLLQNHGVIAFAESSRKALGIIEEVEENCKLWMLVRPNGRILTNEEIDALKHKKM
jgi:ribulose-5-phosphate 4-epimerase/fuculose-1-phosphate aldolase